MWHARANNSVCHRTFVQRAISPGGSQCSSDPNCIRDNAPLLKNIRQGLIDPDTPSSVMSRTGSDGNEQQLVFSDEFNDDGRTFYDGDDAYYQGVDIWYGVTQDLEVSEKPLRSCFGRWK